MSYIEFKHVYKIYGEGQNKTYANRDVNFSIDQGELVVILGPSGAGKSTAVDILGGMDQASDGEVWVAGNNIAEYSNSELTAYRRNNVGFIFQNYNLIPNLTALENVQMSEEIAERSFDAMEMLDRVGMAEKAEYFPGNLSGGEQQRVSIARGVAKNPRLLLCDEPTGSLDTESGLQVLTLLQSECRNHDTTVVIITHDQTIAEMADRIIRLKDGTVSEVVEQEAKTVEEIDWEK